jgi:hypothetical protein
MTRNLNLFAVCDFEVGPDPVYGWVDCFGVNFGVTGYKTHTSN